MANTVIKSMTKEELLNAYCEVKDLLSEIEDLYTPYIGRRIDSMTLEESTLIRELMNKAQSLIVAKKELGQIITIKYGIFVI